MGITIAGEIAPTRQQARGARRDVEVRHRRRVRHLGPWLSGWAICLVPLALISPSLTVVRVPLQREDVKARSYPALRA